MISKIKLAAMLAAMTVALTAAAHSQYGETINGQ